MKPALPTPTRKPNKGRILRLLLLWPFAFLLVLLAAGGIWTQVLAAQAETEFPQLGETIEVEGLQHHVLERGQGEPIVFVHGAYGAMHDYAATILDEASQDYRCILWDRPGHGYSGRPEGEVDPGVQARLLLALIRELELERPMLVGFSYGGAVCLAAAMEDPEAMRGVVLINGPSHPWPDPLDPEYRIAGVPVLGRLLSETITAPMASLFGSSGIEHAFSPLPVPESFEQSPIGLAIRPASYRANTDDIILLKPFLREQAKRYDQLKAPVRALVATGDLVVSPIIHLPQLVELAPDVEQISVEGAGHQLLYTHPELVLETIGAAMEDWN